MSCEKYRDWISWEIDGELGRRGREELKAHLGVCADCARAAEEMRAAHEEVARAMKDVRAPASLEQKIVAAAHEEAEGARRRARARWRAVLRIALSSAAVILIAFGVAAINIASLQASAQEVSLLGAEAYEADAPAAVRAVVRDAAKNTPVAGAAVRVEIAGREAGELTTDASGVSAGRIRVPDLPEGTYPLEVVVTSRLGTDRIRRDVHVRRSHRVLLTSDKPLYQPGQTIRLRALALNSMNLKPVAGKTALFTALDPKGNRIFKRDVPTGEFGVASVDVPLADEITLGRYRVTCEVEKISSEKTVEVKRYVLPKFRVGVELGERFYRPGDSLKGSGRADYFFGKPVDGAKVRVTLSAFHVDNFREFETVNVGTDKDGAFSFEVRVPNILFGMDLLRGSALVRVEAAVTDASGHVETCARSTTVSQQSLRIDALPADGSFVEGLERRLILVTTYPDGSAAKARVNLAQGEWRNSVETDDAGVGEVVIPALWGVVTAEARDARGNTTQTVIQPMRFRSNRPFILRTDRATYRGGDSMRITLLSHRRQGAVYLDLIKAGQTVLTSAVELSGGRGEQTIDLPADTFGTLQVSAYSIEPDATVARVSRVVHVNMPEQLRIRPKLSKETYRPGEEVAIDFEVLDAEGKPVRGALGVSVVDEALFQLSESRPGLEAVYFTIVDELLKPTIEDHGHAVFSMAAADVVGDERAMRLRAAVAGGPEGGLGVIGRVSADEKIRRIEERKRTYEEMLRTSFVVFLGVLALVLLGGLYGIPVVGAIAEGRSLQGAAVWAGLLFAIGTLIVAAVNHGQIALPGLLLVAAVSCGVVLVVSATRWWNERGRQVVAVCAASAPFALLVLLVFPMFELRADRDAAVEAAATVYARRPGAMPAMDAPDEEVERRWALQEAPQKADLWTTRNKQRERGTRLESPELAPGDSVGGAPAPAMRIREYFPETLYWNPQLITDEHGRARLVFPGADSITTWRMSTQAVTARGELGSTSTGLRCFQDFFVDIDFPVALTQGDVVSVPIAVFNYLSEPQTVRLVVDREDWFELLDDAEKTLQIGANQVRGARILLRAAKVGPRRLTVKAYGSKGLNDAVRRAVEVRPNGKEVELSASDRLAASARSRIVIPREAIEGGTVVVVRLSPAGVGEVVKGLENMIRMPHG